MRKPSINSAFDEVNLPVNNIQALQTTRLSPYDQQNSEHPFDAFNLGLHVSDDPRQVASNRRLLQEFLPENTHIQWLEQVHGHDVEVVNSLQPMPLRADAVITRVKQLALAVMTADCLPILLSSEHGGEIAAIHCGWRPLAGNIISHTLNKMTTANDNIYAWLGPCIGPLAFEVGPDVRQAFLQQSDKFSSCFTEISDEKWYANLTEIASSMLSDAGVTNISAINRCTFSEPSRYYSYRRDKSTGRMASIICIT